MKPIDTAAKILRNIRYATLATTTPEGEPWNSPVAHTFDEDLNMYWASDKENQHSTNIRNNGKVFIVIYDSTAPEGEGEGVYIQAVAKELEDSDEVLRAQQILHAEDEGPFLGDAVRCIYKATPLKLWVNDAEMNGSVVVRDFRVGVSVDELREVLKRTNE